MAAQKGVLGLGYRAGDSQIGVLGLGYRAGDSHPWKRLCSSAEGVQYCRRYRKCHGECSVVLGDVRYYWGCSVVWGMPSELWYMFSIGILTVLFGDSTSTLEGIQYCEGYHQYCGGNT